MKRFTWHRWPTSTTYCALNRIDGDTASAVCDRTYATDDVDLINGTPSESERCPDCAAILGEARQATWGAR